MKHFSKFLTVLLIVLIFGCQKTGEKPVEDEATIIEEEIISEAYTNNFIDGSKLDLSSESDINKVDEIITDFKISNLVCGFLHANGSSYNVTVTATESKCFTWVFSKNGKVTSMQSVQAQKGQSYNAYSSDGITTVGINCGCLF